MDMVRSNNSWLRLATWYERLGMAENGILTDPWSCGVKEMVNITSCPGWVFYSCWCSVLPSQSSLYWCPRPSGPSPPGWAATGTPPGTRPLWPRECYSPPSSSPPSPHFPRLARVDVVPGGVVQLDHQPRLLPLDGEVHLHDQGLGGLLDLHQLEDREDKVKVGDVFLVN